MRLDRRAVLSSLLAGAGAMLAPVRGRGQDKGPLPAAGIMAVEIDARAIAHFERDRPDANRFGSLEFRGGLELTSTSASFGGWSGLVMAPDGKSLLAISDVGAWLTAELAYDGERPKGLVNARLGPIPDSSGRPLLGKADADAEAVALIEGDLQDGVLLIAFERNHRIARYPLRTGIIQPASGALSLPAEAARMGSNEGIEGLTVLRGGRYNSAIVAFAERFTQGSGYHTGWMWIGGGEAQSLQLQDIDEFSITDVAGLWDGSLLVLERYYRRSEGVKMRLRQVADEEIAPGARIAGRTLFEGAGSRYEIDNMEGLGLHRGSGGETVLTLVSDDNFNRPRQKTVLLQFTLLNERASGTPSPKT